MLSKALDYIKKLSKQNKKILICVICGLIAVSMIVISEYVPKKEVQTDTVNSDGFDTDYVSGLETRLTEIISQMDGVGRTEVMITASSTSQNEYATNLNVSNNSKGDVKQDSEYVIIKSNNNQQGVLIKHGYPEIQGVLVVCQGGDNSKTVMNITDAVSALLGISKSSISVSKMKQSED